MIEKYITLSQKEVRRLKILHTVMDREVTQVKASEVLGISDRQIRNIIAKLKKEPDVIKKKGRYTPPPDHPWKRHNPRLHHNYYLGRI
jgi:hypothetical protein